MNAIEFKKLLFSEMQNVIKTIEINHVICHQPRDANGNARTLAECRKFIKTSPYHKLQINNLSFVNNRLSDTDDQRAIQASIIEFKNYFQANLIEHLKSGEFSYELNIVFKEAISLINEAMIHMNYNSWYIASPSDEENSCFFVVFNKKQIPFRKVELDLLSYCKHLIDNDFVSRYYYLLELKDYLLSIYFDYLVLPSKQGLPKIRHSCMKSDITELIYALYCWKNITDNVILRDSLAEMFSLKREDIHSRSNSLLGRKKGLKFLKELDRNLSDTIEKRKQRNAEKRKR